MLCVFEQVSGGKMKNTSIVVLNDIEIYEKVALNQTYN
jgi:hypothetical protein